MSPVHWIFMALVLFGALSCGPAAGAVSVTSATDEGQDAWKITTATATYYLQKKAGGLSSMLDKDGRDWISFNKNPGSSGMYRGIPNLIYPDDIYHPDHTWCSTRIISHSSSKVVIDATSSRKGSSHATYEFTDERCLVTMHHSTHNSGLYWFLYEGTPGGSLEPSSDYWFTATRSTRTQCAIPQNKDLQESMAGTGEWICFGDPNYGRVMFFVHHENDTLPDQFYQMENNMTVFGFGRSRTTKHLAGCNTFSFGFYESDDFDAVKTFIETHLAPSSQHQSAQEEPH